MLCILQNPVIEYPRSRSAFFILIPCSFVILIVICLSVVLSRFCCLAQQWLDCVLHSRISILCLLLSLFPFLLGLIAFVFCLSERHCVQHSSDVYRRIYASLF